MPGPKLAIGFAKHTSLRWGFLLLEIVGTISAKPRKHLPAPVGVSPDLDAAARLEVLPRKHLPTPVGVSPATS
jgi:hypothetical protein